MKIVFMGTPIFAIAIMEQLLLDKHEIIGVVSQPDKKVGRKQCIQETPVKAFATQRNIPVFQPITIKEDFQTILDWNPDIIVTCAYGQMIPQHILEYPKYKSVNVHASLLPKLRGGAPIHKAIMYGEKKTGVSIMHMVKEMDAGDYMLQKEVIIEKDETTASLHDKLMVCGAQAIHEALPLIETEQAIFIKQEKDKATYAYNISKEEEFINTNQDVNIVYCHICSLISWPVGHIVINNKKIKLHEVKMGNHTQEHAINTLFTHDKKVYLQCVNGTIECLLLQVEGKSKCNAIDFINGVGRSFIGG